MVITVPSQNRTPGRMLNTHVTGSGWDHDSAKYGSMTPAALYTTRPCTLLEMAASDGRSPALIGSRFVATWLKDQVSESREAPLEADLAEGELLLGEQPAATSAPPARLAPRNPLRENLAIALSVAYCMSIISFYGWGRGSSKAARRMFSA